MYEDTHAGGKRILREDLSGKIVCFAGYIFAGRSVKKGTNKQKKALRMRRDG